MRQRIFQKHIVIGLALSVPFLTGCPVYELTGLPCPMCGVTRAWCSFLQGDLLDAFRCNALFLLIPPMIVLYAHIDKIPLEWRKYAEFFLCVTVGAMALVNFARILGWVPMPGWTL